MEWQEGVGWLSEPVALAPAGVFDLCGTLPRRAETSFLGSPFLVILRIKVTISPHPVFLLFFPSPQLVTTLFKAQGRRPESIFGKPYGRHTSVCARFYAEPIIYRISLNSHNNLKGSILFIHMSHINVP